MRRLAKVSRSSTRHLPSPTPTRRVQTEPVVG
jgi:hypothetical protein